MVDSNMKPCALHDRPARSSLYVFFYIVHGVEREIQPSIRGEITKIHEISGLDKPTDNCSSRKALPSGYVIRFLGGKTRATSMDHDRKTWDEKKVIAPDVPLQVVMVDSARMHPPSRFRLSNTRICFPSEVGLLGKTLSKRPPASVLDVSRVDGDEAS
ncbi:hypothetical protein BDP67DRAFT_565600 [Colletotrichum lupini]|nr:hypothetical protein BDP67DRAFT_565600 [Colletotrichum lupini]